MSSTPKRPDLATSLLLSPGDLEMILDGLHALEYWEYATELDLPRRNGEVFLSEDDPSCWRRTTIGADEQNAIEQIRAIRSLAFKLAGRPTQ